MRQKLKILIGCILLILMMAVGTIAIGWALVNLFSSMNVIYALLVVIFFLTDYLLFGYCGTKIVEWAEKK